MSPTGSYPPAMSSGIPCDDQRKGMVGEGGWGGVREGLGIGLEGVGNTGMLFNLYCCKHCSTQALLQVVNFPEVWTPL